MVVESSLTWYRAHNLPSERHNVILSNPIEAIASAKAKTDRIDSITLVNLLRRMAVKCYVPSKVTMEFRDLLRFRANQGRRPKRRT